MFTAWEGGPDTGALFCRHHVTRRGIPSPSPSTVTLPTELLLSVFIHKTKEVEVCVSLGKRFTHIRVFWSATRCQTVVIDVSTDRTGFIFSTKQTKTVTVAAVTC